MHIPDLLLKTYLGIPEIFADILNGYLYDGRQQIDPEDLIDPDILDAPLLNDIPDINFHKNYSAAFENAVCMADPNALYLIIGIGDQAHYRQIAPQAVRTFETLYYNRQMQHAKIYKVRPLIALVLYMETEIWTAPLAIHDLLPTMDEDTLQYISDYRLPLLQPAITEADRFHHFRSHFRKILERMQELKSKPAGYDTNSEIAADMSDFIRRSSGFCSEMMGNAAYLKSPALRACILKGCTDEFHETPIARISQYIRHDLWTSVQKTEQGPEYSFLFSAESPESNLPIRFVITVLNGSYGSDYPLVQRAIFSAAELISKQEVDPARPEEKLQKVYSIWICKQPASARANSIFSYDMCAAPTVVSGSIPNNPPTRESLAHAVIIHLGKPDLVRDTGILRILNVLLSDNPPTPIQTVYILSNLEKDAEKELKDEKKQKE